ncbi:MAG: DUF3015 family protein [Deltaproteobacteria bacterium]|nr:DUF3015 family protein [Deltaproteobacteria bacterium]
MKKTGILLCCGLMATMAASAAEKKKPLIEKVDREVSGQSYGMAGCGLGSIVFGDKPGMVQIFATTTNGTSGNQTFGISTGTLNCDSGSAKETASLFVLTNREVLAKDISRGSGETLQNFSKILGCGDAAMLGGKLQKNYDVIFPKATVAPADVTNAVISIINSDPQLAKSCAKVG